MALVLVPAPNVKVDRVVVPGVRPSRRVGVCTIRFIGAAYDFVIYVAGGFEHYLGRPRGFFRKSFFFVSFIHIRCAVK